MKVPRQFRADHLDLFEKYVFTAVFTVFAYRMIQSYLDTGWPVTLIYLIDQLIVLGFLLARRPSKDISQRLGDWFLGFSSTLVAVLLGPPSGDTLVPPVVLPAILLLGLFVHLWAKLTLRRSFGIVAANRGVKAAGPYRIVRHPMYLGYVISQTGFILAGPTLENLLVIAFCWTTFVLRISAEERLLMQDEAYRTFCAQTRYRLIPGLY